MAAPTAERTAVFGGRWYLGHQYYMGAGTLQGGAYDPLVTYTVVTVTTIGELRTEIERDQASWVLFDSGMDGASLDFAANQPTRTSLQPIVLDARGRDITVNGHGIDWVGCTGGVAMLNIKFHITGVGFQNGWGMNFGSGSIRFFGGHLEWDPNEDDDTWISWKLSGYITASANRFLDSGGGGPDRHFLSMGHNPANPGEAPVGPLTVNETIFHTSATRGPVSRSGQVHLLATYWDTWGPNEALTPKTQGGPDANFLAESCDIQPSNGEANNFGDIVGNAIFKVEQTGDGACQVNGDAVTWTGTLNENRTSEVWDPSASYPYSLRAASGVRADLTNWCGNRLQITQGGTLDGVAESAVSGKTLTLTLPSSQSWVTAGATFDAQRQNILDGIKIYRAGTNSLVGDGDLLCSGVGQVARTSATVVTVTCDQNLTLDADVEIHAEAPTTAITSGTALYGWNPASVTNTGTPAAVPPQPNAGATARGRRLMAF